MIVPLADPDGGARVEVRLTRARRPGPSASAASRRASSCSRGSPRSGSIPCCSTQSEPDAVHARRSSSGPSAAAARCGSGDEAPAARSSPVGRARGSALRRGSARRAASMPLRVVCARSRPLRRCCYGDPVDRGGRGRLRRREPSTLAASASTPSFLPFVARSRAGRAPAGLGTIALPLLAPLPHRRLPSDAEGARLLRLAAGDRDGPRRNADGHGASGAGLRSASPPASAPPISPAPSASGARPAPPAPAYRVAPGAARRRADRRRRALHARRARARAVASSPRLVRAGRRARRRSRARARRRLRPGLDAEVGPGPAACALSARGGGRRHASRSSPPLPPTRPGRRRRPRRTGGASSPTAPPAVDGDDG